VRQHAHQLRLLWRRRRSPAALLLLLLLCDAMAAG
jgi:hypothetical protein